HGEGSDRRDLRVTGGHHFHAHCRPAQDPDLVEWRTDHDASGRDQKDLLAALVDHLHRGDLAGLAAQRGEDHALAAAALGRELLDCGALAIAVLRHREYLRAGPRDAHTDHRVALL